MPNIRTNAYDQGYGHGVSVGREEARAEIDRLRAALKKYGMHLVECAGNESYGVEPCTCGFQQFYRAEQGPEDRK